MLKDLPIDPTTGKPITTGVWPPREPNPQSSTTQPEARPAPPPQTGEPTDGASLIPQPHGGAILSGAKMGNPGRPGRVPKRSARDRAQDVRGTLIAQLEDVAGDLSKFLASARPEGDGRPRCMACKAFIPGVSRLKLGDILAVIRELRAILPAQHEHEGLVPIQVNVVAGVQIVPNPMPGEADA